MDPRNVLWLLTVFLAGALFAMCFGCTPNYAVAAPVEVRVPVPVRPEVPAELRMGVLTEPLPEFQDPKAGEVSVGLTPEGARRLRVLLWDLRQRITEWEVFAGLERRPAAPPEPRP